MKRNDILDEFMTLAADAALDPDVEFDIHIRPVCDDTAITWYIGDVGKPVIGHFTDYLFLEDLDEDKLVRWCAELREYMAEDEQRINT